MKKLKFGWTYASLEDYRNGVAKQVCVLDETGCPKRPATPEEQRLVEWLKSHGRVETDEMEWADVYTGDEADRDLQERIDSDMPLSELTIVEDLAKGTAAAALGTRWLPPGRGQSTGRAPAAPPTSTVLLSRFRLSRVPLQRRLAAVPYVAEPSLTGRRQDGPAPR
jgi:hypothetical protein